MSHLSSKSEEHRDLAQQALSDTVKMIGKFLIPIKISWQNHCKIVLIMIEFFNLQNVKVKNSRTRMPDASRLCSSPQGQQQAETVHAAHLHKDDCQGV